LKGGLEVCRRKFEKGGEALASPVMCRKRQRSRDGRKGVADFQRIDIWSTMRESSEGTIESVRKRMDRVIAVNLKGRSSAASVVDV